MGEGARRGKPFKPSFYTATIVFTVSVLVLVIIMGGVAAAVPEARQHMSVFVPIVALGGVCIVVVALGRIRQVEKAYAQQAAGAGPNAVLGCPDSYASDGVNCAPASNKMTLDPSLVSGKDGIVMAHTPAPVSLDMQKMRATKRTDFIQDYCSDSNLRSLPWSTLESLCPKLDEARA